jgi:hypothetical protein
MKVADIDFDQVRLRLSAPELVEARAGTVRLSTDPLSSPSPPVTLALEGSGLSFGHSKAGPGLVASPEGHLALGTNTARGALDILGQGGSVRLGGNGSVEIRGEGENAALDIHANGVGSVRIEGSGKVWVVGLEEEADVLLWDSSKGIVRSVRELFDSFDTLAAVVDHMWAQLMVPKLGKEGAAVLAAKKKSGKMELKAPPTGELSVEEVAKLGEVSPKVVGNKLPW